MSGTSNFIAPLSDTKEVYLHKSCQYLGRLVCAHAREIAGRDIARALPFAAIIVKRSALGKLASVKRVCYVFSQLYTVELNLER